MEALGVVLLICVTQSAYSAKWISHIFGMTTNLKRLFGLLLPPSLMVSILNWSFSRGTSAYSLDLASMLFSLTLSNSYLAKQLLFWKQFVFLTSLTILELFWQLSKIPLMASKYLRKITKKT